LALIWLWLLLAVPLVRVEGEGTCPSPQAVEREVGQLVARRDGSDSTAPPDVVHLRERGPSLEVVLSGPGGALIGQRVLDRTADCEDLAKAVAVVIATWESDIHPEFALGAGDSFAGLGGRAPVPAAPAQALAQAPAAPAPIPTLAEGPPFPSPSWRLDGGLALFGALAPGDAGGWAGGGVLLAAVIARAPGGVGARLTGQGEAEREVPLASGRVRWRRLGASAGPVWRHRLPASGLALDLHGELVASWLMARGVGFPTNRDSATFAPGAGAGVRLSRATGRVIPWLDLVATGWLGPQVVYEGVTGASAALPRYEVALALGVSLASR
jgi:hypothetical protein